MAINIENIKKQILDFVSRGDLKKALYLLNDVIRSIEKPDIPRFGEIIAELARKDYKKFGYGAHDSLQLLNRKKSRSLQECFYELDKYLIENYCLLEGETISDSFYGSLNDTYYHIKNGQIFLTNQRVIACGFPLTISVTGPGLKTTYGLEKHLSHVMKGAYIRESLNKPAIQSGIMTYGYYYPIRNAYKIKRGKSAVQYTINVEYEIKGKTYGAKLNMKLALGKMKGNQARKEEILNNLEKTLIKNQ